MKQILALVVVGFALSLCNLTSKFTGTNKSADPAKPTTSSTASNGEVERPTATAAQMEALAGGQNVKWDQQGMSWTVPANWKEIQQRIEDARLAIARWFRCGKSDCEHLGHGREFSHRDQH